MGRKVEVCEGCTQNCLLLHGIEKNSSPVSTSFFKIMVGNDFSKVLYLPPKFGRTVSALVHKKTILKDSTGQQWKVTVSNVDGSFAFEEGWSAFSLEHGLEVGDFLVFNYIKGLHFDVKIYDRSGCERFDFSKSRNQKKRSRNRSSSPRFDFYKTRNQKKRSRNRSGSPTREDMLVKQGPNASVVSKPDVQKLQSQDRGIDSGGIQNSTENISKYDNNDIRAQSMCKAEQYEDPYYMTGRDFGYKERDDRSSMFDVVSLEICNNLGVDGTGKITNRDSKFSHVDYGVCNKDPLLEGIQGREAASDSSEFDLSGRNNSLGGKDKSAYDKTSTMKLKQNGENNSVLSNREVRKCQFAEGSESDEVVISEKKHALHIGGFQNTKHISNGIPELLDAHIHHCEISKTIKKELADMTSNLCSYGDNLRATGSSKLTKGEWGQRSHTIIQDNGSILNAINAEPSYYERNSQIAASGAHR